MAKRTEGITKEAIEERLKTGESLRSIARSFNVSHQALCARRDQWGCNRMRQGRLKNPPSQGRFVDQWGYIKIRTSNRAGAMAYTSEHVLVAEQMLQRKLRQGEVIHHINGLKDDNRPENLFICSRAQHMTAHKDLEQLAMEMVREGRIIFDGQTYRHR